MVADNGSSSAADIERLRADMDALKRDFTKLVGDVRSATTARAEQLYGDLRDNGPEAVRERVRERPMASLAVAFVAGVLLAGFLRR
jgi:hypothetical protein